VPPDPKYAVVPRFSDWEFPHDNLPQYWKNCDIPCDADAPRSGASIVGRDVSCRITAYREGTHIAHLVPASEAVWFNHNTMSTYALDMATVNDGRNLILLRSDLHNIFDARKFAVVPKFSDAENKLVFVVHALVGNARSEIVQLYHDVPLQPLTEIAIEFLFARFAWTIICSANNFLGGGVPRALRVRDGAVYKTEIFSATECMELGKPSPSGNASPRKRKKASGASPGLEEELEEELEEQSDEGLDLEGLDERLEELECLDLDFGAYRALKRRRTSSFLSTSPASVMGSGEIMMWTGLSSAVATN
jgi:hypothetical protein